MGLGSKAGAGHGRNFLGQLCLVRHSLQARRVHRYAVGQEGVLWSGFYGLLGVNRSPGL